MKKIYITGGDNCYCCRCGGLCDRRIMEIDTTEKTMKYIDSGEICLGKYCGNCHTCEDGTVIKRAWGENKWRAYRDGVELPCVVKHNKWGKDGEYGNWGICQKVEDEYVLVSYDTYMTDEPKKTGWRIKVKE